MRIVNLSSGSKANSTFVEYNGTKLLIDVGLSERKLKEKLSEIGENLSDISAVLVTHEHSDHIAALEMLAKKYDMDFYIQKKLARSNSFRVSFKEGKLHETTDEVFEVGEIEVRPFAISHDAISPVGYVLNAKGSKSKVGFLTDVGVIDEKNIDSLTGVKMLFVESNYDEEMLINGFYPDKLKRRILGSRGHLSNAQSLELAKILFESGTKCFVLSHISENNNTYEKAYLNYANYFESIGLSLDRDIFIRLSYQNRRGDNFSLKEEF